MKNTARDLAPSVPGGAEERQAPLADRSKIVFAPGWPRIEADPSPDVDGSVVSEEDIVVFAPGWPAITL